ncbi:MAG: DoxX family protein [Gelidibacter sp.]
MKRYIPFVLRIIIAIILIQTLRFKFTGHPDSIYIFSKVGLEPYGRIAIGIVELIAGVLLLIPKTVWIGAALALGVLSGAIAMHLTVLGIEINNDKGILFITALITFCLSAVVLYLYRRDIPIMAKKLDW